MQKQNPKRSVACITHTFSAPWCIEVWLHGLNHVSFGQHCCLLCPQSFPFANTILLLTRMHNSSATAHRTRQADYTEGKKRAQNKYFCIAKHLVKVTLNFVLSPNVICLFPREGKLERG